jgi:hypothetical protein
MHNELRNPSPALAPPPSYFIMSMLHPFLLAEVSAHNLFSAVKGKWFIVHCNNVAIWIVCLCVGPNYALQSDSITE